MVLSEEKKSEYLESLCGIYAEKKDEKGQWGSGFGNGVFITPSHVLTAWHVITGSPKSKIEFQNHLGQSARMLDGGFKKRDVESDLCIVELDKPIGQDFYVRPINRHMDLDNRARDDRRIGTIFADNTVGNKQVVDDVHINRFYNAFSGPQFDETGINMGDMPHYSLGNSEIHEGHSGSPIIDDDGFVMSITTMVLRERRNEHGLNPSDVFKGADPKKVADFIDSFLFSPESVHCPDEPEV